MLIAAARVVTANGGMRAAAAGVLSPGYVACADGKITAVGAGPPPDRPDVVLSDGILLPGLVDLQVNGFGGVEVATADAASWSAVARGLTATGTTAFLPTLVSAPLEALRDALRRAADIAPGLAGDGGAKSGARVLGVHLEGPFLSPARPGAHNPSWLAKPEPDVIDSLLDAGSGIVRLVTLAPEIEGGLVAVKQLAAAGVLVSIGHSDATALQVSAAAMNGARMVTHLFNAQRPMHHREPGVVGQALSDARLVSSLIADLHHVSGQVAAIAFAAAPGRICLVSDASPAAGMPPGRYVLGGQPIELASGDGSPPVRDDGTVAGSALRMDAAVANMVATGISLADAVAAATRIPADLIGRPDLGRIASGAAADLTWLSDDLRTKATWVAGRKVFGPELSPAHAGARGL
jgi:N-acetylglucosamine-6-phosphate deacetylase